MEQQKTKRGKAFVTYFGGLTGRACVLLAILLLAAVVSAGYRQYIHAYAPNVCSKTRMKADRSGF